MKRGGAFVWVFFLSGWLLCASNGQALDLQARYPTAPQIDQASAWQWHFEPSDVYALDSIEIRFGDGFQFDCQAAHVGIGHASPGALWAVIKPLQAGRLISPATDAMEPVEHVWLRFHPSKLNQWFPPEIVSATEAPKSYYRMVRIARWKMPDAFSRGRSRAVAPDADEFLIDVDTTQGHRRVFLARSQEDALHYFEHFNQDAAPPHVAINDFDAEVSFDRVWLAFNRDYSMFAIRPQVDWQAMRERYRDRALQCTSAYELGCIIAEMLRPLRDRHIWVRFPQDTIPVYRPSLPLNASPRAIRKMLSPLMRMGHSIAWRITGDDIGYIAISNWMDEAIPDQFHRLLESMRNTRGLVIDVRTNGGGRENLAQEVASRFIKKEKIYSYSRYRQGYDHEELTNPRPRSVRPSDLWRYDRPVIVLMGPRCASSNESFLAMMKQAEQVKTMGLPSGGTSGNPKMVSLPVGMEVSLPTWLDLLDDKQPIDERGVMPDIFYRTGPDGFAGERDELLQAALDRLHNATQPAQPIAGAPYDPRAALREEIEQRRPFVTMADPIFGAKVHPEVDISLMFNKPMDPHAGSVHFARGGFWHAGPMRYDPQLLQFTIPVTLQSQAETSIVVNAHEADEAPAGFQSPDGIDARSTQWSIQSRAWSEAVEAASPVLLAVTPPSGAPVHQFCQVKLALNQPIDPHAVHVSFQNQQGVAGTPAFCPRTAYDASKYCLTLPVLFPPHWQGIMTISEMRSADGQAIDPITLVYQSGDAVVPPPRQKSGPQTRESAELREYVAAVQKAIRALDAFDMQVQVREFFTLGRAGYQDFSTRRVRFVKQGERQFLADVGSMMEFPFQVGCDGQRTWLLMKPEFEPQWRQGSRSAFDQIEASMLNPLGLQNHSLDEVLSHARLERTNDDTLLQWRAIPDKQAPTLFAIQWQFDPQTYLPRQCRVYASHGAQAIYDYAIEPITEPLPVSAFQPIGLNGLKPAPLQELGRGYDERFIRILDGSNGVMSVRWGKRGEAGEISTGLN